ncbi:MAG: relaxase, partial [Frondihabitans sp.]|nr:relaxase [Frondihabitans sp.]
VQMREVPFEDRAAWAHLARDTAGAFAAWSQRVEMTPGPLAQTARDLSRTAQIRAHQSRPRRVGHVLMAGATAMLLQAASQGQGSMAEALLLRQLASTVKVVMEMHAAIGDAQRAAQINRTLTEQYTQVRDRLPSLVKPEMPHQSSAVPTPAETLDPELAKIVKAAQQGQDAPGTGSPIPNRIDPYKPRTAITPNERDGHER